MADKELIGDNGCVRQGVQPGKMSWGELGAGVVLGERAFFLRQKQLAIVVAANIHHRAGDEQVGGARGIERACQVISQIHDLLDASAIDILQDRFQGPTIPMDIGKKREG